MANKREIFVTRAIVAGHSYEARLSVEGLELRGRSMPGLPDERRTLLARYIVDEGSKVISERSLSATEFAHPTTKHAPYQYVEIMYDVGELPPPTWLKSSIDGPALDGGRSAR